MNFKVNIFRNYILPLFAIFLVPASCYYFYGIATGKTDGKFIEAVTEGITEDKELSQAEKSSLIEFYKANPPSLVCNSTDQKHFPELKEQFKDICGTLKNYALLKKASLWTLLISLIILALVSGLFIVSYISQKVQYYSFVVAWNIAKTFSIAQVLVQGALLVSFLFYGPVLLFDHYFPKLLLVIGAAAAYAAFKMIMALLKKVNYPVPLKGRVLRADEAPMLYSEIKDICKQLNTQAPDNIVLGVEDNFFVTEHPVLVGEVVYSGRTLFASILHLENLSKSESSSIFAHEMAHFSGQDTWYSKKTSPMLIRCGMYFDILDQHFITLPVFFFLLVFRSLFEMSFSKISCEREKRADALAAKLFDGENLANALGKFVLYSNFRSKTEEKMFSKEDTIQGVNLLEKITSGFSSYLKTDDSHEELLNISIPHPFDSHPPIAQRIKDVGVSLDLEELKRKAVTKPRESWFTEIQDAREIRNHLVEEYENEFMKEHEQDLAYRYLPSNNTERALVEKHFPPVNILSKSGDSKIMFDYEKITYSEWNEPVYYSNIKDSEMTESMMKKYIVLKLEKDSTTHKGKAKFCISKMKEEPNKIIDTFNLYYIRHNTAVQYSQKTLNS